MATNKRKATGGAAVMALAIVIATPFVAGFEGKRNYVYLDSAEVPTYCFGHADRGAKLGEWRSDAVCERLLTNDVRIHAEGVDACLTRELPAETLAASVSLTFNIGVGAFCRSTIARRFNAGDLHGGCNGFPAWDNIRVNGKLVRSNGLARRRAAERVLCLKGLA